MTQPISSFDDELPDPDGTRQFEIRRKDNESDEENSTWKWAAIARVKPSWYDARAFLHDYAAPSEGGPPLATEYAGDKNASTPVNFYPEISRWHEVCALEVYTGAEICGSYPDTDLYYLLRLQSSPFRLYFYFTGTSCYLKGAMCVFQDIALSSLRANTIILPRRKSHGG